MTNLKVRRPSEAVDLARRCEKAYKSYNPAIPLAAGYLLL